MLILARKIGETIILDGGIKITVANINGNQVKVGSEAPADVNVWREVLLDRINSGAAGTGDKSVA